MSIDTASQPTPDPKVRIVIELYEGDDTFGVDVAVTGDIDTAGAVGLMEIAKQQHLTAKQAGRVDFAVYQTPDPS